MPIIQNLIRPQTIYMHYETTNKSFINMHYYLKSKGIQNNDFFLALYDRDLRNVNPRDPNLSNAMKTKILIEVKRNFW